MTTILSIVFIIACVGIWYFQKKVLNKNNRNIAIGIAIVSFVLFGLFSQNKTNEEVESTPKSTETSSKKEETTITLTLDSKEVEANENNIATITGKTNPKATVSVGMGVVGDSVKSDSDGKFSLEYELSGEKNKNITINATLDGGSDSSKITIKPNAKILAETEKKTEASTSEKSNDNTPESVVKRAIDKAKVKDAKTKIEGNNLIICYTTEMALSNNSLVTRQYPDEVAKMLKELQGSNFENIIIQTTTTFTDNRGNESQELALSTFFTKTNLDSINFDNWEDRLLADGTILYSVADGYMIHNSILNESKTETQEKIGNAGKSNDNAWWFDNGYTALQ